MAQVGRLILPKFSRWGLLFYRKKGYSSIIIDGGEKNEPINYGKIHCSKKERKEYDAGTVGGKAWCF